MKAIWISLNVKDWFELAEFFVLPLGLTFILVAAGVVFRRRLFCIENMGNR
jgi:hypothetical protein